MTDGRSQIRYRKLYARLLRLYPAAFRTRFAESMEQTFNDLCRERQASGRGLFAFALRLFAETLVGIIGERSSLIMPPRKNIIRLALATVAILLVPLLGMQFSEHVDWSLFDFVAAGVLLFGTGLTFELVARRTRNIAYRVASGLACATVLLLIWSNLAVGIIGSEDGTANLLYIAVLVVAVAGAVIARLRPRGMARVLFTTALAQAIVPLAAIMIWKPLVADGKSLPDLSGVLFLNAVFVLLFVASALLYRRAADTGPKPG